MPPPPFPLRPPKPGMGATGCILALDFAHAADAAQDPAGLVHHRLADLDPELLAQLAPLRVFLPLVGRNQDAIQMILTLQSWGYAGPLTVLAPALPDRAMVEAELRALGPGLRLDLLTP